LSRAIARVSAVWQEKPQEVAVQQESVFSLRRQHVLPFRDQPDQKDDYRGAEYEQTHVSESAESEIRIRVAAEPRQEKYGAYRQEDFQGRIQRGDLEDNGEEPHSVANGPNATLALAPVGLAGLETDRVAGAQEGHRNRGRL